MQDRSPIVRGTVRHRSHSARWIEAKVATTSDSPLRPSIAVIAATLLLLTVAGHGQDASRGLGAARQHSRGVMKIKLTSVFVDDQEKALRFYTDVLGFVNKRDIPVGAARWLTVVSPEEPDGTELLLEPSDNPAAKTFKKAIFEQGIPAAAFAVDDIRKEYERLSKVGVSFTVKPTNAGPAIVAVFDDTCGSLIQIYQASGK